MLAPSAPDVATLDTRPEPVAAAPIPPPLTEAGRAMHREARLFDPAKFPLLSRGFNWIQERPFNR